MVRLRCSRGHFGSPPTDSMNQRSMVIHVAVDSPTTATLATWTPLFRFWLHQSILRRTFLKFRLADWLQPVPNHQSWNLRFLCNGCDETSQQLRYLKPKKNSIGIPPLLIKGLEHAPNHNWLARMKCQPREIQRPPKYPKILTFQSWHPYRGRTWLAFI